VFQHHVPSLVLPIRPRENADAASTDSVFARKQPIRSGDRWRAGKVNGKSSDHRYNHTRDKS
jgi:hypothetical protein